MNCHGVTRPVMVARWNGPTVRRSYTTNATKNPMPKLKKRSDYGGTDTSNGSASEAIPAHSRIMIPLAPETVAAIIMELTNARERLIREQRRLERQLLTDSLTQLGNGHALDLARRSVDEDRELVWAFFDGNGFGLVNKACGQLEGDRALRQFASVLITACADYGIPARCFRPGGDEFALVSPRRHARELVRHIEARSTQIVGTVHTSLTGAWGKSYLEATRKLASKKRRRKKLA